MSQLTVEQAADLMIRTVVSGAMCARLERLVDAPARPKDRVTRLAAEVESDLKLVSEFLKSRVGHSLVSRDDLYHSIFRAVQARLTAVLAGLRPAMTATEPVVILNALMGARTKLSTVTQAEQAGAALFSKETR